MKVLHVLPSLSPKWGGPVYYATHLVEELVRRGLDCSIIATEGSFTGTGQPVQGADVRLFKTDVLSKAWIGHAPGLMRELKRQIRHTDVVHIHELWHYPHWAAFRVATRNDVPYIISLHGQLDPWMLRHRAWAKRVYYRPILQPSLGRVAALHVLSEREAAQARAFGLMQPTYIIPNAVDTKPMDRADLRAQFYSRFGELREKRLALFLGRLHPQKGVDALLDAFASVVTRVPNAHLIIAGPDEVGLEAGLRRRAQSLGLASCVTFSGPLYADAKRAAMAAADLFVLPSRAEGQSSALLEAMAAGLPVIVTPAANSPDVSGPPAGLVARLSAHEFGAAMERLLCNTALAQSMGRNGQRLVEEHFTWGYVADEAVRMYNQVIRGAARHAVLA